MRFAGRCPPTNALKRERFMAEREWWHNWRSGKGADDQKLQWHHFYTYMRSEIELNADNYDFRIQAILASWRFIAASSDTAFSILRLRAARCRQL